MSEILIGLAVVILAYLGYVAVRREAYRSGFLHGEIQQMKRCIKENDELAELRWRRLVSQQQEKEKSNICES